MRTSSYRASMLYLLRTATESAVAGTAIADGIIDWVIENGDDFEIDVPGYSSISGRGSKEIVEDLDLHIAKKALRRPRWSVVSRAIGRRVKMLKRDGCHIEAIGRIGQMAGLDAIDVAILDLVALYHSNGLVEKLWDTLSHSLGLQRFLATRSFRVWSCFLGIGEEELAGRFIANAPLLENGFLLFSNDGHVHVSDSIWKCINHPLTSPSEYRRLMMGESAVAELPWDDFEHLGKERERLRRMLTGALESRACGINILIYGLPGTGKTQFCKTLAAELGFPIFSICESDLRGHRPNRDERTSALALAQKLTGRGDPALLLFDEAEDVLEGSSDHSRHFGGGERNIGSKVFFHRLLENTPVPVLWTTNTVDGFGDAVLRRMTYALEMPIPPARVRERIWRRQLERSAVKLDDKEILSLAREFEAAPSLAASAITAAKLTGGGAADIRSSLKSVARIMSSGLPSPPPGDAPFEPCLVNADIDLIGISERLADAGDGVRFSMCLSGPAGTGKSAYAAYLAERLDMPLLRKRGSDLFDMYVGGTEKNIARAFADAQATGSLLLFDEADSFLGSRQTAVRSWEITQVNEMLTWMERHPLPFICTTNLVERLDEAAARRFLIKARFGFLNPDQVVEAFVRFFDVDPPSGLQSLVNLTPADFAIVRRKAQILAPDFEPPVLMYMLRQENAAKQQPIRWPK